VAFQFATSIALVVAVLVVFQQMQFIQNKDLGYDRDFILNFETQGMSGEKQQAFLQRVRNLAGVSYASGISHALFGGQKSGANITWRDKDPERQVWFEYGNVDYDMLELLGIDLVEGRFFSRDFGDERSKVVINQAARELMDHEEVIGSHLTVGDHVYEIIGVTEDFHFQSLHETIAPTFFLLNDQWSMKLAIRIEPRWMQDATEEITKLYSEFNPGYPFQYAFHDQDQQASYQREQQVTLLFNYAAILAILISCLGLYGLVSFVIGRKTKELSIRKVLGARGSDLIYLIGRSFLGPLVIAIAAGMCLAGFAAQEWLNGFAYRIQINAWVFLIAIAIIVLLLVGTASSQFLKVLSTNPVDGIKEE